VARAFQPAKRPKEGWRGLSSLRKSRKKGGAGFPACEKAERRVARALQPAKKPKNQTENAGWKARATYYAKGSREAGRMKVEE